MRWWDILGAAAAGFVIGYMVCATWAAIEPRRLDDVSRARRRRAQRRTEWN